MAQQIRAQAAIKKIVMLPTAQVHAPQYRHYSVFTLAPSFIPHLGDDKLYPPPSTISVMLKQFVICVASAVVVTAFSAAAQPALAQSRCLVSIEGYLSTLPAFSAPGTRNVFNSLRQQGALHLQSAREGRLSAARDIPGYEQQLQSFINSGRQALANHTRMGGQLDESICNPPDGSQASAWASTQMGVAFNTWAINIIRCTAGESNFAPIPQFCPDAAQTNVPTLPAPSPVLRDDPKVFGRSARGG